ncbi:MAG: TetR family transcriptional regulator [Candidatus Binatia bacterium]
MKNAAPTVATRAKTSTTGGRTAAASRAVEAPVRSTTGNGATAQAILKAALDLFARDGFDGASIPSIAKAASIGHPLVHYHFGSKENLWRAAVDHAFDDLQRSMDRLEESAAELAPVDALQKLLREFAGFTARHPAHTFIILNELRSGGARFDWLVERHLGPLHSRLDRFIDAAIATGSIRPVPAAHLSSIAIGATVHFFGAAPLLSRLYNVATHDPDVIEAHSRWVLEILMKGLAVAPGEAAAQLPGETHD